MHAVCAGYACALGSSSLIVLIFQRSENVTLARTLVVLATLVAGLLLGVWSSYDNLIRCLVAFYFSVVNR